MLSSGSAQEFKPYYGLNSWALLVKWLLGEQEPDDPIEEKSAFFQVMAWCHQATSHFLKKPLPEAMLAQVYVTIWHHFATMNWSTPNWLFNSLFTLTTKKTSKFFITGPLRGQPTNDMWIPHTKGPVMQKALPMSHTQHMVNWHLTDWHQASWTVTCTIVKYHSNHVWHQNNWHLCMFNLTPWDLMIISWATLTLQAFDVRSCYHRHQPNQI